MSSVGRINKEKSEDRHWPEGFGNVQAKIGGLYLQNVLERINVLGKIFTKTTLRFCTQLKACIVMVI